MISDGKAGRDEFMSILEPSTNLRVMPPPDENHSGIHAMRILQAFQFSIYSNIV